MNLTNKKRKLNPVINLVLLILCVIIVFSCTKVFVYILLLLILLYFWISNKISWKKMFFIFISFIIMFGIILLINWVSYRNLNIVVFKENNFNFKLTGFLKNICNKYNNYDCFVVPGIGFKYHIGDIQVGDWAQIKSFISQGMKCAYKKIENEQYIFLPYISEWYSISLFQIIISLSISLKIFFMLVIVNILNTSMDNNEINKGFYVILSPLKIFKLPVKEWSLIISLAFRFVPSFVSDANNIMIAQASRGLDSKNGKITDKIKSIVSLMIPLFIISFSKSNDLANAMFVRGYSTSKNQTVYRTYRIKKYDYFITFIFLIFFFISMFLMIYNVFFWYPSYIDLIYKHAS